ncbi:type III restriction-modification system endonuclease [Canibacter sp. lx-72]|uniref:type III restriction-modification system endonuclease n=1 Tax=Canibacter zhuwentaonis TaxID=2837491 RepID=UPI001BDC264B|nr:type III restriction-modification system endonuclease [Canibacter zhuwentaonis]MBT1018305.1 type III restriction-modification system endonuclease [Canibacter zhuwentaonis]
MQIRLQTLDHQQRALIAATGVFAGVDLSFSSATEANPVFDVSNPQLKHNIAQLQAGAVDGVAAVPRAWRTRTDDGVLGVDIKMETGTGKTLVYTQLLFELNRLYGFHKFIILVPSTPIKEGTRSFMKADYAQQYFDDTYGGRFKLDLDVLDPQQRSKGRKMFPAAIANFVQASRLVKGRIRALLMTDGMLQSKTTMATVYDQSVLGMSSQPYEALAMTRPVVIIDEPHRFRRENKAYQVLLEQVKPQAVFRFGATFPKFEKSGVTDYNNLVFNLGPVEAFNEQLVKGVTIQYPQDDGSESVRLKLTGMSRSKPKSATFNNLDTGKSITLRVGESLGDLDGDFAGLAVESVGKTENALIKSGVTLSNGQILTTGDILASRVYSETYQSLMMKQALDNHFETEWENFRRSTKVKTLTLFFIDSIESYRGEDGPGHLRACFHELLAAKLGEQITERKNDTSVVGQEYLAYLRASLADVAATNGGYFSADNSSSDDAIQAEVDQILRDKESLLSFVSSDGTPNTMRFIFSKWTLREGWDNPNVFQIVKLRSSGSEISKLQEVGRGLRLPVDVSGARLAHEQFYLTYLIDYTEKSFANRLIGEINSDVAVAAPSVKELLPRVAAELGMSEDDLFFDLWHAHKFVDCDCNILEGKEQELFNHYPQFNVGKLKPDKVVTNKSKTKVGIRPGRYAELKELWEAVNAKYYLRLEDLSEQEIETCVDGILDSKIYTAQTGRFTQETIGRGDNGELIAETSTKSVFSVDDTLTYADWLKGVYLQTYLPIQAINAGLVRYNAKHPLPEGFFNRVTLSRFVAQFYEWMKYEFINRFSYTRIDAPLGATALTEPSGEPLRDIVQGNIGIYRDASVNVPDKFLYDAFVYDSPKEKDNIQDSDVLDEVVVYGKIPRRSIRVPVYFGGSTSPDFMYVLKGADGKMSLNFIIETKDVDAQSDLRELEKLRFKAARRFFDSISDENIKVQFSPQLKHDDIIALIKQVVSQ